MDANQVSELSLLSQCESPLAENENFRNALELASPERKQELHDIQNAQSDFWLRQFMQMKGMTSEADLLYCKGPLNKDAFFLTALQCASPDRREQLLGIQSAQLERINSEKKADHRQIIICILFSFVAAICNGFLPDDIRVFPRLIIILIIPSLILGLVWFIYKKNR